MDGRITSRNQHYGFVEKGRWSLHFLPRLFPHCIVEVMPPPVPVATVCTYGAPLPVDDRPLIKIAFHQLRFLSLTHHQNDVIVDPSTKK
jgi:hypothetical protein